MTSIHHVIRHVLVAAFAVCASAACTTNTSDTSSPSSSSTSVQPQFAGTWEWQPGATSVVECNGATVSTTDLSNPQRDGKPAWFMITDDPEAKLHDVDVLGCVHEYVQNGLVASIIAGSTCSNYPDGRGGMLTATTTNIGTKTLAADGQTLTSGGEEDVVGQPCKLRVSGTAKRAPGP